MASPSINWDDFENQALLVLELLSDPIEVADSHFTSEFVVPTDSSEQEKGRLEDSPLLITKVAMPQTLLMLSPEMYLHGVDKYEALSLTPVKRGSEKLSSQHLDSDIKSPLKDCTNKILTDNMTTPENFKSSEKSQRALCPSSAEFRKFLDDIMTVSPEMNNNCENAEETTINPCQLKMASKTPGSLPVVKGHVRRGTYDLDVPSCNLSTLSESESNPVPEEIIKPIPNLLPTDTLINTSFVADDIANQNSIVLSNGAYRLQVSEKYEADDSDQTIPIERNSTWVQKDYMPVGNSCTLVLKCNSELRLGNVESQNAFNEVQKDNSEVLENITELQKVSIEAQSVEALNGIGEVQYIQVLKASDKTLTEITEVQKEDDERHRAIIDMQRDDVETHRAITDGQKVDETHTAIIEVQTDNIETHTAIIEVQTDNIETHTAIFETYEDKTAAQKTIIEVQTDDVETQRAIIEVQEDKTAAQKALSASDSDLKALKPGRSKLLFRSSSLRRPQSRSSSTSVGVCVKPQVPALEAADIDHMSCLHRKSSCDIAEELVASEMKTIEHGKSMVEKTNTIQQKREENVLDTGGQTLESGHIELSDFKYTTHGDSSSDDSSAEKQQIPDALSETSSRIVTSVSDPPGKTTGKADLCPSTVVLKKVPVSKLPLMRPGQMQSKLSRPSGLARLQSQRASSASVKDEGIKRSNAVLPLKPVMKQQMETSDLGQKKNQETSRLLPKLCLRPPSKVSSKVPLDQSKLEAKICKPEAVKLVQPQKMMSLVSLEGTQPAAPKPACRPPVMKGSPAVLKGKVPVKTDQQIDGSRTVTKKISPMKALFPHDGSRTITKEAQADMSRTVTKAVQPAGSRTVTKNSDVPLSKTPNNRQSLPGTTDKFIAPRRLSNVFNKPSSLCYSSKNSSLVSNSHPKAELDSSGFESMATIDEFGAFKPKHALVQNTPDVRPRRLSMWSPVKRNTISATDLAYQCTKRVKGTQDRLEK